MMLCLNIMMTTTMNGFIEKNSIMIKPYPIERHDFKAIIESGLSIEWHVSTELGAKGIQKLFKNKGINIKVKWISAYEKQ